MNSSSKHGRPRRAKTLLVLAILIVSWFLIEGGYRIYLFVENNNAIEAVTDNLADDPSA